MISFMLLGCANAITIESPVNNFHYNSTNIPVTALSDTNTTCSLKLNSRDYGAFNLTENTTYSVYLDGIVSGENTMRINCTDKINNIVFYKDVQADPFVDIAYIVIAVLGAFGVIFLIFKS
jgi:hypothetical protein